MNGFLQVDKDYFDDKEPRSTDMLILSQIKEFNRNGYECYVTNKQFSEMLHASERTIANTIDRLVNLGYIKRKTSFVGGNGRANRQRVLSIGNKDGSAKSAHSTNDANAKSASTSSDGSAKFSNGNAKSDSWKCKDCTIKDKEENNKKKNSSEKKTSTPDGALENYEFITSTLGIKCTEKEYIDACSKYDNIDYDNVVYFRNLLRDGMNIFEYVDAIKDSIG